MMFWPQFEKFVTFLLTLVRQMLPRHQISLEALIQVLQGGFNQCIRCILFRNGFVCVVVKRTNLLERCGFLFAPRSDFFLHKYPALHVLWEVGQRDPLSTQPCRSSICTPQWDATCHPKGLCQSIISYTWGNAVKCRKISIWRFGGASVNKQTVSNKRHRDIAHSIRLPFWQRTRNMPS